MTSLVSQIHQILVGHPLLVDLKYRREIESLSPDIGLRGLLLKHPDDILEVRVSSPAVLKDIDEPDDYGRALRAARKQARPTPEPV